jgi:dimethylargininase
LRVFDFNSAIVRTPGRSVVNGLRAHPGPQPDFTALLAEHAAYVAALRAAGLHVTVLPALEEFPDSIFVEDPALVFREAAVLLRPGAPSRMAEAHALSATLAARFADVLQLRAGFVDGGDIFVTPQRVFIGLSARTDAAGAAALQALLASIGLTSVVVQVPRGTLHLKTDCALIDEETVIATESLARSKILEGFEILLVPPAERAATNAVRVNDVLFVRADCPRTQEMLAKRGLTVIKLPVSEISKIDAGLSCMSLRWFEAGPPERV